jgi:NADPH:quinone reductase
MSTIRAVVVDPEVNTKLVIQEVEETSPLPNEAVIQVEAISLNRGEVRMAQYAPAGKRPGWDFAGTVLQAAADGSGAKQGARVVGMVRSGAWTTRLNAPTAQIAELPDGVTFAQASTLPVAGLTAYHALSKGGLLLGKPVLITGATGGVGDYAIQLAKLSGAKVVAHIRRADQEAEVREAGADAVVIGDDITAEMPFGAYWLILDSVGGETLGQAMSALDEGGTVVSFGTSGGNPVTFDAQKFYGTGALKLYGFILFDEFTTLETAGDGLKRLAELIADGKLTPHISVEDSWENIGQISQDLLARKYPGKAVLTVK